jgi:hypothetical protein
VEFVEELAKERPPAPELLVRTESSRRDKKDKSSWSNGDVGGAGAGAEEPRSAWQWPFVIHTTSQDTHLILAPTAEVRDNWVVKYGHTIPGRACVRACGGIVNAAVRDLGGFPLTCVRVRVCVRVASVSLEEGIAEAKLRARKSKSKSQKLSDLSARTRYSTRRAFASVTRSPHTMALTRLCGCARACVS